MTEELKPCPFCGFKAEYRFNDVPFSKWKHSIECASTTCGASGPVEDSKDGAVVSWNTRAKAEGK